MPRHATHSAPALGSRSPPKPTSPSRDRTRPQAHQNDVDENEHEPALVRFARLKQRETATDLTSRPGGPKNITSPLKPEKWSVKDTSVNIATAFIQAATTDMSAPSNHNGSWAASSSSSRPPPVPRSTSVEFESNAPPPASSNRRLAPPPNKLSRPPVSATGRKPASKPSSRLVVPDSEGEQDRNVRGKSPFERGMNIAKQAIGAAAFYVRQRSHEPENLSGDHSQDRSHDLSQANGHVDGNDSSYSYTQEERSYQAAQRKAANRKVRMSEDNKAYKPSLTDEESSEMSDDGQTHKKRKIKKGGLGGPLTSLPVVTSGKRRKKRRHGTTKEGADGGADESSGNEDDETVDVVCASTLLMCSLFYNCIH
jgi:SUN domain-containing protein 1/2